MDPNLIAQILDKNEALRYLNSLIIMNEAANSLLEISENSSQVEDSIEKIEEESHS